MIWGRGWEMDEGLETSFFSSLFFYLRRFMRLARAFSGRKGRERKGSSSYSFLFIPYDFRMKPSFLEKINKITKNTEKY